VSIINSFIQNNITCPPKLDLSAEARSAKEEERRRMRKCSICGSFLVPCNEGIDHTCLPAGRSAFSRIRSGGLCLFANLVLMQSKTKLNMAYLIDILRFSLFGPASSKLLEAGLSAEVRRTKAGYFLVAKLSYYGCCLSAKI
jgi:hypothetical protein